MHIVYFFSVDTSISSGKNRATRHKIDALKKVYGTVEFFTLDRLSSYPSFIAKFFLQFQVVFYIFKNRREIDIYISRGVSPLFAYFICKIFCIATYREVHADIVDEIPYLNKSTFIKFLIRLLSLKILFLDKSANVRVFNNPLLKKRYIERGLGKESDKCVYNGASQESVANISKCESKLKFGFQGKYRYLVFTGSASTWHGVHYLVELQRIFNLKRDNIKIVCAGGKVSKKIDPNRLLINLSPLNDIECSEVIKASEACLLPVNNIRVSPGSPLKLYDYMINGAPVIAQIDMPGYSDEVDNFNAGFLVDFTSPNESRDMIVKMLDNALLMNFFSESAISKSPEYLWDKRVVDWFC